MSPDDFLAAMRAVKPGTSFFVPGVTQADLSAVLDHVRAAGIAVSVGRAPRDPKNGVRVYRDAEPKPTRVGTPVELKKDQIESLKAPCTAYFGQAAAIAVDGFEFILIAATRGQLQQLAKAFNSTQVLRGSHIYPVALTHESNVIREGDEQL